MYNYQTISQRENITNPTIAEILNYLERVSKNFKYNSELDFVECDWFSLSVNEKDIWVYKEGNVILKMPTQLFRNNIVGLLWGLKNITK